MRRCADRPRKKPGFPRRDFRQSIADPVVRMEDRIRHWRQAIRVIAEAQRGHTVCLHFNDEVRI
jgi:hypothetical protein